MNHSFNVATAEKYGVEEAIFIENMRFWLAKNKANERHFYDGRYWTYNSAKAFAKLFPYWSASQVNRIIKKLETEGILVSGNYNQSAYDRTKWYSLNEEIHFTNSLNGNDESVKTLIRTDSKPEINSDVERPQKKATSLPAGFLPNETGHAYAKQRGLDAAAQLQSFKNHHEAKGSTFKDWQAAWRTWCDKAVQFGGQKQNQTETVYQRSMRLKMQEAVPSIAKQAPEPYQDASDFFLTIDMETQKAIEVSK